MLIEMLVVVDLREVVGLKEQLLNGAKRHIDGRAARVGKKDDEKWG